MSVTAMRASRPADLPLDLRRRFYAEEIEMASHLQSRALVEALAAVPRERFLRPGPWIVRGEADVQAGPHQTPDADPRHVYHNVAIAIDPARHLFNGGPGLLAMAIDRLAPAPGNRVLHIGAGTGYYTALLAACVGESGSVTAIEADEELAAAASGNLAEFGSVRVQHGDATGISGGPYDAILVNAGVTHPLDIWLDGLAPAGRMMLPLTVAMTPTLGKGPLVLVTRTGPPDHFDARLVTLVAIYSAVGVRDATLNDELANAMKAAPLPPLKHFRRDAHEPSPSCWFHSARGCWSLV